jgi:hypothetical protein
LLVERHLAAVLVGQVWHRLSQVHQLITLVAEVLELTRMSVEQVELVAVELEARTQVMVLAEQ